MRRFAVVVPFVALALAGCSQPPAANEQGQSPPAAAVPGAPALADASVHLPVLPGRPAVAYFTLTVPTDAKGKLTGVEVAHFGRAEMHQSRMDGGAMTMADVTSVPLVPGKPIVFAPGGYHVMLFDFDGALKDGATTTLTATFDSGTKVTAQAKVTAPGGDMGGMKM
jgi:periplasmic copper chaperone A